MTGERELPDWEREAGGEERGGSDWVPSGGGAGAKNPTFRTFGSITREGRRLLSMAEVEREIFLDKGGLEGFEERAVDEVVKS